MLRYRVQEFLPFLDSHGGKVKEEFEEYAYPKRYSKGQYIHWEGDDCVYFYLVLSGSIRVYKSGECGREVTLYKVRRGETCILTAFSLMTDSEFPANAVADEPTEIVEVPKSVLRDWLNRHEVWRNYLFSLLSNHLTEIITRIESLVFQRVDERIAHFLIRGISENRKSIQITHSDIAREVGTAREVVSRILKNFEKAQLISLSRKNITVLNQQALSNHGRAYSLVS